MVNLHFMFSENHTAAKFVEWMLHTMPNLPPKISIEDAAKLFISKIRDESVGLGCGIKVLEE